MADPDGRSPWAARRPLLVSIAFSLLLLGLVYRRLDLSALAATFARLDPLWLGWCLLLFVPQYWLIAWRLTIMVPAAGRLTVAESLRMTLATGTLNLFLPSNAGHLARAWMIRQRGLMTGSLATAAVVFEKVIDTVGLLAWGLVGLACLPRRDGWFAAVTAVAAACLVIGVAMVASPGGAGWLAALGRRLRRRRVTRIAESIAGAWAQVHRGVWGRPRVAILVVAATLAIWLANLAQVWTFIRALGGPVDLWHSLGLTPIATMIGMLPITFAGVGSRDVAFVVLYQEQLGAAAAAAVGVFCTLRYLLLAAAGVPYIGAYLSSRRELDPLADEAEQS